MPYVVGPRSRCCDRTAGDSSPVTQENGRLRGRPGPSGGICSAVSRRLRRPSPTQHDARTAHTAGPPCAVQLSGQSQVPCWTASSTTRTASSTTIGQLDPCRGTAPRDTARQGRHHTRTPCAAAPDRRQPPLTNGAPPGAASRHRRCPDVGADVRRAPRTSVPWGPSPCRGADAGVHGRRGADAGQVRDAVPQPAAAEGWMSRLRSYGSVVGPVGGAPLGVADRNCGCRKPS